MIYTKPTSLLVLLLLFLPYSTGTLALPDDRQQPIHISADNALKDDNRGITIYRGNVKISQGSMHISGSKVSIYENAGAIDKVVAIGSPARFKQRPEPNSKNVIAHAKKIEYSLTTESVVLLNNARLEQEGRTTTSNRIVYDMQTTLFKAGASDGRVTTVIQPSTKKP